MSKKKTFGHVHAQYSKLKINDDFIMFTKDTLFCSWNYGLKLFWRCPIIMLIFYYPERSKWLIHFSRYGKINSRYKFTERKWYKRMSNIEHSNVHIWINKRLTTWDYYGYGITMSPTSLNKFLSSNQNLSMKWKWCFMRLLNSSIVSPCMIIINIE